MKIGKKHCVLIAILDHLFNLKFKNAIHLFKMHREYGIRYVKNGIMVPKNIVCFSHGVYFWKDKN